MSRHFFRGWIRDSGERRAVVVNNAAPNPAAPAFIISAAPTISIGGLNNDPRLELVSYSALAITPGGNLAIAPTGSGITRTVRIFAPPGRFIREIGRGGEGPGEFRNIASITALKNDSLLVHDRGHARVSLFDPTGKLVEEKNNARGMCCMGRTTYVQADGPNPGAVDAGQALPRDSMRIQLGTIGSAAAATPREMFLPGYERPICLHQRTGNTPCNNALMRYFASQPIVRIAGNEFIHALPDRYEYRVYSSDSRLVRTVRAPVAPRQVSRADIDSTQKRFMGAVTGNARRESELIWSRNVAASNEAGLYELAHRIGWKRVGGRLRRSSRSPVLGEVRRIRKNARHTSHPYRSYAGGI